MNAILTSTPEEEAIREIGGHCLLMRTRLISRVVTSIYDDALRPFGMGAPQFALLVVIFQIEPASRAEIGRFHRQERSTLTRNLKVLLSEGWIEEIQDAGDGRARPVALTLEGKTLLAKAKPAWEAAQTKAKALLGESGVAAVAEIAKRITHPEPAE